MIVAARKRLRTALALISGALALALAVGSAAAHADSSVLPSPGAGLPWADPAHQSALESFASSVAAHIAGRPVAVQCNGDNDWSIFAGQWGFDPAVELGFVPFYYSTSSRAIVAGGDRMFLGPTVCLDLQLFGTAASKPTKCQGSVMRTTSTDVVERYAVVVKKKVKGRLTRRVVWLTRKVPRTTTTASAGPLAPCYAGGNRATAPQDDSYWSAYARYARALWTLAHESIHQQQFAPGAAIDAVLPASETDANCYGLQWLPYVAEQFGAAPDDAQAIAEYAYDKLYPGYRGFTNNGSPYWSSDCRSGGPLDLTPGDNLWP